MQESPTPPAAVPTPAPAAAPMTVPFTPSPALPPVGRQPPPEPMPREPGTPMTVRATHPGYYGDGARSVGEVFVIDDQDFSPRWMAAVEEAAP